MQLNLDPKFIGLQLGKITGVTILNDITTVNPNDVVEWLKLLPQIAIAIHSLLSIFGIKIGKRKKQTQNDNSTN